METPHLAVGGKSGNHGRTGAGRLVHNPLSAWFARPGPPGENIAMFSTIISALLPVVITLLLGYFAGRHHDFTPDQADVLTRLVLLYALPADLFVGMATTKRSALIADIPLIVTVASAILISFAVTFFVFRRGCHATPGAAALFALAVSSPSVAFVGTSVLGYLYGQQDSAIPISIATLTSNLLLVPVCLVILSAQTSRDEAQAEFDARALGRGLEHALRQPMVWAPILGFLVCLAGIDFPASLERSLGLLGAATGGVSLFAAGVILYAQHVTYSRTIGGLVVARNLAVPGLTLLGIHLLGAESAQLREAVIALAIPLSAQVAMLAVRYQTAEQEIASALLYSTLASIPTLSLFIWLTR